jgi:hypothetical protein
MEPKDFYFQLVNDRGDDFFFITPKEYYDREGCLPDDSRMTDRVLPQGFEKTQESIYEFDGNPKLGRDILINLGMVEINFGLTPGEPVRDEDEGYDEGQDYHKEEEEDENDLDELLKDDSKVKPKSFDYANLSTDQLLRHKKVMVDNEDYMEAAKIQKELDSRN